MIVPAYALKDTLYLIVSASNVTCHAFLATELDQHSASNVMRKRDTIGIEISVFRVSNAALGSIYQTSDALIATRDALNVKGLQKRTA